MCPLLSQVNINDTIKLVDFEQPSLREICGTALIYRPINSQLCVDIATFHYHGNKGRFGGNVIATLNSQTS